MSGPSWTPERDAVLRALWGRGETASVIAAQMPGTTRNGVIGRAHRLGLAGRESPIREAGTHIQLKGGPKPKPEASQRAPEDNPSRSKPIQADPSQSAPAGVKPTPGFQPLPAAMDLHECGSGAIGSPGGAALAKLGTRDCRWPLGDPREPGFAFCGQPRAPTRPYCAAHCAVAYRRSGEKEVAA